MFSIKPRLPLSVRPSRPSLLGEFGDGRAGFQRKFSGQDCHVEDEGSLTSWNSLLRLKASLIPESLQSALRAGT